ALHGARYDLGIADVAAHELARAPDAGEAAVISTRVVVEDAHAVPFAEQALDERASEEAGSARPQVGVLGHRFPRAASRTSAPVTGGWRTSPPDGAERCPTRPSGGIPRSRNSAGRSTRRRTGGQSR